MRARSFVLYLKGARASFHLSDPTAQMCVSFFFLLFNFILYPALNLATAELVRVEMRARPSGLRQLQLLKQLLLLRLNFDHLFNLI